MTSERGQAKGFTRRVGFHSCPDSLFRFARERVGSACRG